MSRHYSPLFLVLFCCYLCAFNATATGSLNCRQVESSDTLVCEFTVSNQPTQQTHKLQHCNDDICIQSTIQVTPVGVVQQQIDSTLFSIGTHSYNPLLESQAVQAALKQKPKKELSLQYADWLVAELGAAHRENEQEWDVAIMVLSKAVEVYTNILSQEEHDGNSVTAIYCQSGSANAHMVVGELLQLKGRTKEAIQHYEASKTTYETLINREDLHSTIREELIILFADSLVRLGVLQLDQNILDEFENDEISTRIKETETMLGQAVTLYSDMINHVSGDEMDNVRHDMRLANALQNYASAILMASGDMKRVLVKQKEALIIYMGLMEKLERSEAVIIGAEERDSCIMFIAELLISLSDSTLQAGQYKECNRYYKDAMEWYNKYNLQAPSIEFQLGNDETIAEHEKALNDYQASLYSGQDLATLESDERYEADLHATLGALKLSEDPLGTAIEAYSHLQRAIDMYEMQGEERSAADAYLNLATGKFREGKFAESSDAHQRAVEIYERVIDKGTNPLMAGLNDMLTKAGIDIAQLTAEFKTTTETEEGEGKSEDKAYTSLIDLDALQQSLLNVTVVKEEL